MQQKIATQIEALDIAMKLEDSLVGEIGVGMNHIQSQLANLTIQLQYIKKGKKLVKKYGVPNVTRKDITNINAQTSAMTCFWDPQIH